MWTISVSAEVPGISQIGARLTLVLVSPLINYFETFLVVMCPQKCACHVESPSSVGAQAVL